MNLADLLEQPALRVLELTRRAVAASDDTGRIVYVNARFCREFGVLPERVVGIVAPEHLPGAARASWLEEARHWRRGIPRVLCASLPDAAGVLRPYLVLPVPIADAEGKHLGILATFACAEPGTAAAALGAVGGDAATVRVVLKEIVSQLSGLIATANSVAPDLDALRPSVPELVALTDREWAVASRIGRGDRTQLIAAQLGIRENTVRNHLKAIFRKTGVRGQSELVDRMEHWRAGRNGQA